MVQCRQMLALGTNLRQRCGDGINDQPQAVLRCQNQSCSPFVLPSLRDPMRPISVNLSVWRLVKERAGFDGVRLHHLRQDAAPQGISLPTVTRLLGHHHVRMTLRHVHVHDSKVADAAQRITEAIVWICEIPGTSSATFDKLWVDEHSNALRPILADRQASGLPWMPKR